MNSLLQLAEETKKELLYHIIPFWMSLRDERYGGYYGWLSYDLELGKQAEKGCILNSRITWFFANAYTLYKDGGITGEECQAAGYGPERLLEEAKHGYAFLTEHCIDRENGGIYWSLKYDGTPLDTTKHTYNQAFCIYALSSYYEASGDKEALALALELFDIIEKRCTDAVGYLEAFTRDFRPESNEKLSENGVLADKTMNTLLHVFEAYTELYRVSGEPKVRERLAWMLGIFAEKVYNPAKHRQEVFFDAQYRTILDLHSYGHDIETAWLMDKGLDVLNDTAWRERMSSITADLVAEVYRTAFNGESFANECEKGVVNTHRIWWVQAEALVGFLNAWQRMPEHEEYLKAAFCQWEFIKKYVIDSRKGSEWFWEVNEDGSPIPGRPIVEPWKCPYHNGRMCMEVIRRASANL